MSDAPPPGRSRSIRSRTFAALIDNPDYRRFYLGQGVSLIGTWLQAAAVSWIVFEITGSEWWLGVVDAAGTMPGLLVGLVAGALADRVVPRTMVLVMQTGQMLLAFLLAYLVATGAVRIWQMAAILALARVCVTFEMPSRQVFLYELVGRESLTNAIALNSGLFNASRVIGPALAGVCLAQFGRTVCFTLNGASYLAAIAALLSIRAQPRPEASAHQGRGLGEILGGLDYLRHDVRVRTAYFLMAFFGIFGMGYAALVPAFARLVVHTGARGYSLLLACGGIGATAGALLVASLGGLRRKEHLALGGIALFAIALAGAGSLPLLLPAHTSVFLGLAIAGLFLMSGGFGAMVFYASIQTMIQTAVPDRLRGRIMGIWMIVYSGSVPLGSLWAGQLAQRYGVARVMQLSAVICLIVVAGALASGVLARPEKPVPPTN
jgi:MFS family permease